MTDARNVRDKKQLFIDGRWFAESRGVRLVVNPPRRRDLVDWPIGGDDEGRGVHAYLNVAEDAGRYRMWYDSRPAGASTRALTMRYAESDDGLTWRKPELGLFKNLSGIKTNNVVMPGAYGSVMLDPHAPPEHRYKALCDIFPRDDWDGGRGAVHGGKQPDGSISYFMALYLLTSPDGIHWKRAAQFASPYFHDSQNQLLYDRRLRKYVAYLRWMLPDRPRVVGRLELDDPMDLPWPFRTNPASKSGPGGTLERMGDELDPVIFTDPGTADPPEVDIYCPCVTQYPWADDDYYLSFMPLYRHYPDPGGDTQDTARAGRDAAGLISNDGPIDVRLATSADGVRWTRPDYSAYLRLGLDWDAGCVYAAPGLFRDGDTIRQYYVGFPVTHGHNRDGRVGVATSRLDGFVSADADYAGGAFTTPTITFAGDTLEVNADCSALGELRVELRDEGNRPIPGYELNHCFPVDRNHVAARVAWKAADSLAPLAGRPVKMHVHMRDCKLYAYRFRDSTATDSPGGRA